MYKIITPETRSENETLLDDMFRHRYNIVVQQWGWEIPGARAPYERDQFDKDDTVYIVVHDPVEGCVTASSRLNPTLEPHMLSETFPEFCDLQPYPQSATTWEWTRLVVDRARYVTDRARELKVRSAVSLGIHKYCTDKGITELSFLTHQFAYKLVQKVWDTEPLGLPKRAEQEAAAWIAAKSQVNEAAYQQLLYRHNNAEAIIAQLSRDFIATKSEAA